MKNAFYFTKKALFILNIFEFLFYFGHAGKRHDKKAKLIITSKSMMSQTGKQIITIHIFPNISRSKGSQTVKFRQLTECNMRNISLEKSYTKCGGETSHRPFSKRSKLSISPDQQCKVLYNLFSLYVQVEGYRSMLKLTCGKLAFTSYKAFLKSKAVWN